MRMFITVVVFCQLVRAAETKPNLPSPPQRNMSSSQLRKSYMWVDCLLSLLAFMQVIKQKHNRIKAEIANNK